MPKITPYGSWTSPISAADAAVVGGGAQWLDVVDGAVYNAGTLTLRNGASVTGIATTEALRLISLLADDVGLFKIGLQSYTAEGDVRISGISTGRKAVKPNFVVDDATLADFREQLKADRIKMDEEGFKKDLDFVKAMV